MPIASHALLVAIALAAAADEKAPAAGAGELRVWHAVTIALAGPEAAEGGRPNPFRDYRLDVTFSHGDRRYIVPGYYAADGRAAESGASSGNCWRVHFVPDAEGAWRWQASFRAGPDVAIGADPKAGRPVAPDGASGQFDVLPSDKTGLDLRARGMARYVGERYLQFAGSKEFYIKGGADSPENFLAYADFDGTWSVRQAKGRAGEARPEKGDESNLCEAPGGPLRGKLDSSPFSDSQFLHRYGPHVRDWRPGDPTWRGGRGKGIIGALNYLASKGMNSVYLLPMNVEGDGRDVWPWTAPDARDRYDVSKLDQWEIVFSHMDRQGIFLHVVTQETENDQLLDGGELGPQRRLYYRELAARFGHHLGLVWNLGEENTNTDAQRKAFCRCLQSLDPYGHAIVVHTFPGKYDEVYKPLLGEPCFHGASLQMGDMKATHAETLKWVRRSQAAGRKWIVSLDEIGPADTGVKPDRDDPRHDAVRRYALWGNLMAGGAGCEWYFGYKYPHNDLDCEDFRSREAMWDQTRHALEFFRRLPFWHMEPADELTAAEDDYCLAERGKVYAVYLARGGTAELEVADGRYAVKWFNPRSGGDLRAGSVREITGPGRRGLGRPPGDGQDDWAVLVTRE